MGSDESIITAWSKEYKRKGIPSSFRNDPSKTVVEFIAWLKNLGHKTSGIAVDVGCGLGRNSFYLASQGYKVNGLDLLEENVNSVNAIALSQDLPVRAFAQDASSNWPIKPNSLDIAIDIFCYKHLVNKKSQESYRLQLAKALKADGFYFLSLASENDGFYGPLLQKSNDPKIKLIVDPYSNIPSILYSIEDLGKEFANTFEVVKIEEHFSTSPMYEKEYPRVVINAIFRKRAYPL